MTTLHTNFRWRSEHFSPNPGSLKMSPTSVKRARNVLRVVKKPEKCTLHSVHRISHGSIILNFNFLVTPEYSQPNEQKRFAVPSAQKWDDRVMFLCARATRGSMICQLHFTWLGHRLPTETLPTASCQNRMASIVMQFMCFVLLLFLHNSYGDDPQPQQIHLASTGKVIKQESRLFLTTLFMTMHDACHQPLIWFLYAY